MENRALTERIVAEVMARIRDAEAAEELATDIPPDIAAVIDHTLLRPDATPEQIDRLCDEAATYRFAAVCVQPCHATRAIERLSGRGIAVASVVGFPHGASVVSTKRAEAEALVRAGVDEIDMVIPVGFLKARMWTEVASHIAAVVEAANARPDRPALVKVIIEAPLLSDEEKVVACIIAEASGAGYVKTSTGFAGSGATIDDVRLMRRVVGNRLGVKAAGGIRTRDQALAFLSAGASRLGTSAGPSIVGSGGGQLIRG